MYQHINQYKKTKVNTANPGQLVVMLYEGAIKAIDNATAKMDFHHYDYVNEQINKAIEIVSELRLSLDKRAGEIANNLESIYVYIDERLKEANFKKDAAPLKEAKGLLTNLLEAWREIASKEPQSNSGNSSEGGFNLQG